MSLLRVFYGQKKHASLDLNLSRYLESKEQARDYVQSLLVSTNNDRIRRAVITEAIKNQIRNCDQLNDSAFVRLLFVFQKLLDSYPGLKGFYQKSSSFDFLQKNFQKRSKESNFCKAEIVILRNYLNFITSLQYQESSQDLNKFKLNQIINLQKNLVNVFLNKFQNGSKLIINRLCNLILRIHKELEMSLLSYLPRVETMQDQQFFLFFCNYENLINVTKSLDKFLNIKKFIVDSQLNKRMELRFNQLRKTMSREIQTSSTCGPSVQLQDQLQLSLSDL